MNHRQREKKRKKEKIKVNEQTKCCKQNLKILAIAIIANIYCWSKRTNFHSQWYVWIYEMVSKEM